MKMYVIALSAALLITMAMHHRPGSNGDELSNFRRLVGKCWAYTLHKLAEGFVFNLAHDVSTERNATRLRACFW